MEIFNLKNDILIDVNDHEKSKVENIVINTKDLDFVLMDLFWLLIDFKKQLRNPVIELLSHYWGLMPWLLEINIISARGQQLFENYTILIVTSIS